jgi:trimeric autotransporter adhesin
MVSVAPTARGIDVSVLATPARTAALVPQAPKNFTTPRVALPEVPSATVSRRLIEVQARKNLVDPDAAEIKRAGADKDLRATFTLHRALDGLRTLAEAATAKSLPAVTREKLNNQFAQGVAQVENYIGKAATDKLILQFGGKVSRSESKPVPKIPTAYTGVAVVKGARTTAIPGLTGSETFAVTLSKAGRSDTVAVNLADISGPITLSSVAALINDKIAGIITVDANGVQTPRYASRFEVVRTNGLKENPALFALKANTSSIENINFADAAAGPVSYLITKSGDTASLQRLETINGVEKRTKLADLSALDVKATAVDSTGALYVVGTTTRDISGQSASKNADLVLTKYDSNGVLQFARKLGAVGNASGAALAIDSQDNVIVGGNFNGKLNGKDIYRGEDSLIVKFNSSGAELFAQTLDSVADDGVTGISIGADDSIYLSGVTKGALPGQTAFGLGDTFIAELAGNTGALLERKQFGTAAADKPALIVQATNGDLLHASVENGALILRRFAGGDISAPPSEVNLGTIGAGSVTALAVDPLTGDIVLAGKRTQSSGNISEAFVLQLESSLTQKAETILNSTADISAIAFSGLKINIAGRTNSALSGSITGITDSFTADIETQTNTIENIKQFGVAGKKSEAIGLAVTDQGPGALALLGLRQGPLRAAQPAALIDRTSLRAGDNFKVAINGGAERLISIDADDDLPALAKKIRAALGSTATVTVQENTTGTKISIAAKSIARIDLRRGGDGADLLGKLGLAPGQLRTAGTLFDLGKSQVDLARTAGGAFALDLTVELNLEDRTKAAAAKTKIETALTNVQRAYRSLYYDPAREAFAQQRANAGTVPAFLTKQLGNYQEALARLQAGSSGFGLSS